VVSGVGVVSGAAVVVGPHVVVGHHVGVGSHVVVGQGPQGLQGGGVQRQILGLTRAIAGPSSASVTTVGTTKPATAIFLMKARRSMPGPPSGFPPRSSLIGTPRPRF
jgi:hypothetical protein